MMNKTAIASSVLGALLLAPLANATTISYTDIIPGASSQNIGGVLVSAFNSSGQATLAAKCNGTADANHCGFGVNGGAAGAEIDYATQDRVVLDYSGLNGGAGVDISSIRLTMLYNGPEFGDTLELARIYGDAFSYTLSITGQNTAVWSGGTGIVTNCSPTDVDQGGCFEISNPFAGKVTSLQFWALDNRSGGSGNNSDYGISQVSHVSSVPEPASLGLMGLALAGLGFARRRRGAR